ncbi:MAG: MBL fold metallo-hydrolase [Alphaproteobacteria bacterium]|nr:MBL fold metallo-hydrolase [Alphaproteobacteria bacterium]
MGRLGALAAVAAFVMGFTGPVGAQSLDHLARAMGADRVKTVQIKGTGFYYHLGGSALANEPWPKFNLKAYDFLANYETGSAVIDLTLSQFLKPPRGAGFQPIRGELKRRARISGDVGWGINRQGRTGPSRNTAPAIHALWTSPHGVIRAAQAAGARVTVHRSKGQDFYHLNFGKPGAFKATARFGPDGLLRRVDARLADEVLGDMRAVTTYSDYKLVDGVKFPMRMTVTYGPHPALEVRFTEVRFNVAADIKPPKGLKARGQRVKAEKAADGIWHMTGGSHHSVAIEMADHVIVFEAPLSSARGEAVIAAVKKTIPGKPIRFVINSHHHFDHSGGLRAFVAEGATIITHRSNKAFYVNAFAAPRTLRPDRMATEGRMATFLPVGRKHVISDGTRRIELHALTGNPHCESNLIAVLPKERIMLVADAYSGRQFAKKPLPKNRVNPTGAHLWRTLVRLGLDKRVDTLLPIHGRKSEMRQIRWMAGVK